MRLVLVRHGESIGNFENRLQGQQDYDLTETGYRQAELTAERLAGMATTAVYTSPLLRARRTAEAIGRRLGLEPVILPEVSEYDFGDMSGATYAEVRRHFAALSAVPPGPEDRVYPGEEGRDKFAQRVKRALWRVAGDHPGESVAVVSHGGPIALFCQSLLGLPYRRPMPFVIANCSLAVVEVEDVAPRPDGSRPAVLRALNDVCHLRVAPD